MSKPISPKDVTVQKAKAFPPFVFEAFNELIAQNYTCGSATVKQKDVVTRMVSIANKHISDQDLDEEFGGYGSSVNSNKIYDNGWLNVEEVYREQGWKVSYDKPGYNESYDAYFVFKG